MYVEGQLQTRKWQDQSGAEKYTTEVVLQRFRGELQMLDRAGGGGAEIEDGGDFGQRGPLPARGPRPATPGGGKHSGDLDDEIPF